ncbi:MAG TPA: hypothetical protein PK275_08270 [Chitinophagaceae bacterium]|jgi:hypothetical protein|nr:hypothetical protein [Chitinophagaceae bacterium]
MLEEYEKKRKKQVNLMRSMMDYTMGLIIIIIGVFFFFLRTKEISVNQYLGKPDMLDKVLGAMCLLYGAWRIYRGYQKKYFR